MTGNPPKRNRQTTSQKAAFRIVMSYVSPPPPTPKMLSFSVSRNRKWTIGRAGWQNQFSRWDAHRKRFYSASWANHCLKLTTVKYLVLPLETQVTLKLVPGWPLFQPPSTYFQKALSNNHQSSKGWTGRFPEGPLGESLNVLRANRSYPGVVACKQRPPGQPAGSVEEVNAECQKLMSGSPPLLKCVRTSR